MKKLLILLTYCFLGLSFSGLGQTDYELLHPNQVLELVRRFHPLARQSQIHVDKAQADVISSKAGFNPVFSNYVAQKTFAGVDYYGYQLPEIKIPVWFGVEVYAGLENVSGSNFLPSETLGRTSFVGVSVPLAKNLLMDKRRATLKQAQLFNSLAKEEQAELLNNLYFEAMTAYWEWVKAHQKYEMYKSNLVVNEKRLEFVKKAYFNGERPAIDTLEALAQLQSFQSQLNMQWVHLQQSRLQLSGFLWQENEFIVSLPDLLKPAPGWNDLEMIDKTQFDIKELISLSDSLHPKNKQMPYKINALEIDKKLKFQELLPKIDVSYNQLGKGYDLINTATAGPLFENNFQYGLKIELPLMFSQGRGDYRKAKLKIEETRLEQLQIHQFIELKTRSYYQEFLGLKEQIRIQNLAFQNYSALVKAEETRLLNGESSLFIVNSRQNKAIEAQEKLIELQTAYHKCLNALFWSAGIMNQR